MHALDVIFDPCTTPVTARADCTRGKGRPCQVPLRVADETFYLDLLFYHIRLHRFVVIELKTGKFQPERKGKLAFYLAAVNGTMRTPVEAPSIGIFLCESRAGPIVDLLLRTSVSQLMCRLPNYARVAGPCA